mgnify:CR=1 FL=1
MARRRRAARATLSRLSARAKKLLLMRIYLYAIASGNTRLLKMFGARSVRKGRKSRRRRRSKKQKHRKSRKHRSAKQRAATRKLVAFNRRRRR